MDKQIDFLTLKKCKLFKNITTDIEIEKILTCTHFVKKKYKKNEYIVLLGDILTTIGVIVEGQCDIVKEDFNGNYTIISVLKAGDIYGESLVFSSQKASIVSIVASTPVTIYHLNLQKLISRCGNCYLNNQILENLMTTISNKNIVLNKKISILSQKTIRDKLLTYFEDLCIQNNSNIFALPITKTKLANYLNVDRSSMSRELKNMQDENIININKKIITLNLKP